MKRKYYHPEAGLKILKFLGFRLTSKEQEYFVSVWQEIYFNKKGEKNQKALYTTWEIYASEELAKLSDYFKVENLSYLRDHEFGRRLVEKDLLTRLEEIEDLEDDVL
jgi:hypothetical protein